MPTRIIRCEACHEVLGELEDGVFTSRHHRRRFVDPVIVECRCRKLWINPDVAIDDERAKRVAKVLASSPVTVVAAS
jgi:hypothetical protein